MSYADTRTWQFEEHLATIEKLRQEAYDLDTLARAYIDYADDVVRVIPTKGAIADRAARHISDGARALGERTARKAADNRARADEMERRGIA